MAATAVPAGCMPIRWHEADMPTCAGCANKIIVRGEQGVAVPVGPILEHVAGDGRHPWVAHWRCRRWEWWAASLTDDPTVRLLIP